jgi:hypothetical protein
MRVAYKILIVAVILLFLFIALFLYANTLLKFALGITTELGQSNAGRISLHASLSQNSVLTYNDSADPLFYSLFSYATVNAVSMDVNFDVYTKSPFERIYLVNVSAYCISCFNEAGLEANINASLQKFNLLRNASSFSYIPLSGLALVPNNSIVIIPSGLLPVSMLNGTGTSILTLLNRGDTVFYVGQNFSRSLGPNGLVFVTPQSTLNQLGLAGLQTGASSLVAPSSPASPLLPPPSNLSFRNPTFSFFRGFVYQNVSYANSGNGTLIAFSNYPKYSWSLAQNMASDIVKVMDTRLWLQKISTSSETIDAASRPVGNLGLLTTPPQQFNRTYTFSQEANNTYSLVTVVASNPGGSISQELSFRNFFVARGSLGVPATVGETQDIPIVVQVNNVGASTLMHINIYDRNLSYVGAVPVGFMTSAYSVQKFHTFSAPSGFYILTLNDFTNKQYAATLMYLAPAEIEPSSLDFKNGTFVFTVSSLGMPVTNETYSVSINNAYNTSGVINDGVVYYTLPKGTIINYGNQFFEFKMFNSSYGLSSSYQQILPYIPAIYIEFAIAVVVVVLLNLVLKPPNRDEYYIDVPEFPAVKRERVKLKPNDLLSVFDKVNYYYRWKYMPLTADEIKLGIGNNVRVNNMPVAVTLQNTNMLLSTLVEQGSLVSASGYYAPKAWVEASRHSAEYLTMFRRLRDYCVSHAMLFTDLDADPNADMLITKEGKHTEVYLYTDTSGSRTRPITLSRDTRTTLLFLNEEAVHDFVDELYASLNKEAEVMKLGIEYNYVKLLDADHLDQLSF